MSNNLKPKETLTHLFEGCRHNKIPFSILPIKDKAELESKRLTDEDVQQSENTIKQRAIKAFMETE